MEILKSITGAAGVFFPIGKPPKGTCEFSDKECLKKCVALTDKPYDEEYRITESTKQKIYKYFMTESLFNVCTKIIQETTELRMDILHWFCSGDCLHKDQERIVKIINLIGSETDIIQMGFTRNRELWERVKFKINMVLTCDSRSSIPLSFDNLIYAVPDYKNRITDLYCIKKKEEERFGGCGGTYIDYISYPSKMTAIDIMHESKHQIPTNCKTCFRKKYGCFYKSKEE